MEGQTIYTIGYGKRELDELIALLKEHGITFLVDVRSAPYSKFKPEFSKDPLAAAMQRNGIRYVFMGDLLGGRPDKEECYVDGKVDYERLSSTEPFRRGIERLRTAWKKALGVCIMCSEGRPEECHRSKLIGEVLEAQGIRVQHIDADGSVVSQKAVLQILTGGQMRLFDEPFTSRKKYRDDVPCAEAGAPIPMKKQIRIVTVGVYGFDEESFFSALAGAGIDTFCDIRLRRGLRGSTYAFANSRRLQERLAAVGIQYVHLKELAPSQVVRDVQKSDDCQQGISKRSRTVLSPAFVKAYEDECLGGFTAEKFFDAVGPNARVVALFCVEREPEACHRSIVADRLAEELGIEPEHVRP